MFFQEHWLPDNEACMKMKADFEEYDFLTTSDDMFTPVEDLLLESGAVWHGSAIAWHSSTQQFVSKLEIVNDRFCGIKYEDMKNNTNVLAYSAYLPTTGKDDEFLEVVTALTTDNTQHHKPRIPRTAGKSRNLR